MNQWLPYQTLDPLDPASGEKVHVKFPQRLLKQLEKYDPIKYWNIKAAIKVLDNPKRIFHGLRRPFMDGGWCYVGKPNTWYVRTTVDSAFPVNYVYAVYCQDDLTVFDWRSEYADADDSLNPKGWKERYRSLIWTASH